MHFHHLRAGILKPRTRYAFRRLASAERRQRDCDPQFQVCGIVDLQKAGHDSARSEERWDHCHRRESSYGARERVTQAFKTLGQTVPIAVHGTIPPSVSCALACTVSSDLCAWSLALLSPESPHLKDKVVV